MTPLIPVIALLIVSVLLITGRNANTKKQVLGNTATSTESILPSATAHETPSITPVVTVIRPTNTLLTPSTPPSNTQDSENDWKYPNSLQVSGSGNNIQLESSDNPNTITTWYKEKIRGEGYNAKSFVATTTNGKVLNKLVGAKSNQEVRVEITKEQNSGTVKISVQVL